VPRTLSPWHKRPGSLSRGQHAIGFVYFDPELPQLGKDIIYIEACRPLALRIIPERRQELTDVMLRGDCKEGVVKQPAAIGISSDVRTLVWGRPEIEYFRPPQA